MSSKTFTKISYFPCYRTKNTQKKKKKKKTSVEVPKIALIGNTREKKSHIIDVKSCGNDDFFL